ncbi:MAG: hypothetical protein EXX96DRAFT_558254 [Benjaminiella poitrasii]|nr:MAG: hypothetical protein EXX96DRAFT_558254 [Benjaminiella poitrasii]
MTRTAYYHNTSTGHLSFEKISYIIHNFSDLYELLKNNNLIPTCQRSQRHRKIESTRYTKNKALMSYKSGSSLPKSIRYHSASAQLIEGLMLRAIQHWCCISFKVAPIELDMIQKKNTPKTILYCVAAISMIILNEQQLIKPSNNHQHDKKAIKNVNKATEDFKKDIAYYFYEKARHFLEEIIFQDEEEDDDANLLRFIIAIQCYFCLSYTANLLRLTTEHRTWHYFACVLLKSKAKYANSYSALKYYWYRWHYIDAWTAIITNQECLLPDQIPFEVKEIVSGIDGCDNSQMPIVCGNQHHTTSLDYLVTPQSTVPQPQKQISCYMPHSVQAQFVNLSQYMRKCNKAIRSNTLCTVYGPLTAEVERWWANQINPSLHLKICYFSMRLVVLFSLLQVDDYQITFDLLLDGLEITLKTLQGLEEIKFMKCDLSTYHHMFYAIHQTLKVILLHIKRKEEYIQRLEKFAKQQFIMNLVILESLGVVNYDLYQMKSVAANIESDLYTLGYLDNIASQSKQSVHVFRAQITANSVKSQKRSHRIY